jgi:hypothetical protein
MEESAQIGGLHYYCAKAQPNKRAHLAEAEHFLIKENFFASTFAKLFPQADKTKTHGNHYGT